MRNYLRSRNDFLQFPENRPLIMGVLNVNEESFSDGGMYVDPQKALSKARQMLLDGADIIDVGGESTAPDSIDVTVDLELVRVLPVIETLQKELDVWISIDTWKSSVAEAAIDKGARIVNDIGALRFDSRMAEVLAAKEVALIMMFSKDDSPRTTLNTPVYKNIFDHLEEFFDERIKFASKAGIDPERIILDSGMGAFLSGDYQVSLDVLRNYSELQKFGLPLMLGASRKGFIGKVLNVDLDRRLIGGLACAWQAWMQGAQIIRTHDVAETRQFFEMMAEFD